MNPSNLYKHFRRLLEITADQAEKEEGLVSLHKIYEIYIVEMLERKLFI